MKSQHTPGPWIIKPTAAGNPFIYYGNKNICGIALVRDGMDRLENESNAALIAAAPELLEQLERLVNEFEGLPHSLGYEFTHLPAARAAIAKAKGD